MAEAVAILWAVQLAKTQEFKKITGKEIAKSFFLLE